MAKLNYQRMSREVMLRNRPIVNSEYSYDNSSCGSTGNDNLPVILNGPTYILKFGKHKGKMLQEVSMEYLKWAILNIDGSTVNMFIRELQRRDPSFKI